MRDIEQVYVGKRQTSLLQILSRAAFGILLLFMIFAYKRPDIFVHSTLDIVWIIYLVGIYVVCERTYSFFKKKGIDLTFAFPLLLAVYVLNLVSVLLDGQTRFPLMNRAEHFTSFVLLGYIVWVFFVHYLPQKVWKNHPYYTALLVFSVTAAFGSLNEIIELGMDTIFSSQAVGDRYDTSLDILMNSLGTGLFLSVRLVIGEHFSDTNKK